MLELRNVNKSYRRGERRVEALCAADLDVKPGEFVTVRGPSGCGKSTLLFTAGTLLRPEDGDVRIADAAPYDMNPEERAAFRAMHIGFIFQRFHLVPYLDVLDNVLVGALPPSASQGRDRALELLDSLGLSHRLDHCPAELSTGESQRVGLARALLNDPDLILADEPTGNLDPDSGRVVLETLAKRAEEGAAILMVTHGEEAGAYATRTVKMKDGRILS